MSVTVQVVPPTPAPPVTVLMLLAPTPVEGATVATGVAGVVVGLGVATGVDRVRAKDDPDLTRVTKVVPWVLVGVAWGVTITGVSA